MNWAKKYTFDRRIPVILGFFLWAGRRSPELAGQGAPVDLAQRVPRAHALLRLREEAARPRRRLQQDQRIQAQGGLRRAQKGALEIDSFIQRL